MENSLEKSYSKIKDLEEKIELLEHDNNIDEYNERNDKVLQRYHIDNEDVIETYRNRNINRNLYVTVNMTQPVIDAVVTAINICNRTDIRYENYEHYFDMSGRAFKLKVLDILVNLFMFIALIKYIKI